MLKTCMVEGCGKKHYGKGYCNMHYTRLRTHGSLENPTGYRSRNHPDKCTVPGCDRPYASLGYCAMHYIHAKRRGEFKTKICQVADCPKGVYAKGYCHRHWVQFKANGKELYRLRKCAAPDCTKKILKGEYCPYHERRVRVGMPLNATHSEMFSGPRNPLWKGGAAEYLHHSEFKRQRKIRLQAVGYTCELCGDIATIVHHKDGSKTNHAQDNLQALCHYCHCVTHSGRKCKTSKLLRKYGKNSKQIAQELNLGEGYIKTLHAMGKLDKRISQGILPKKIKNPKPRYTPRPTKYERIYGMTMMGLSRQLSVPIHKIKYFHEQGRLQSLLTVSRSM